MTNFTNTTLYIGITNDLKRRVIEHKSQQTVSFTQRYHLTKLVYYEPIVGARNAIIREMQLKNWHRNWKDNLIKQNNPQMDDLSESVLGIQLEDAETSSA